MTRHAIVTLVLFIGLAWSLPSKAEIPDCSKLSSTQGQILKKVLATLHPYDGCDSTFERCLAKKPPSPVVLRQASDICRQVKAGKSKAEIERALFLRGQTMLPVPKPATFALDSSALAGDPQAPIQLVVYACARCPFCKVVLPALYKEVTTGSLKGKARLYFRPFPLKSHEGAVEGGLGMMSAARLGKLWPFTLELYKHADTFCPALLPDWAAVAGLDKAQFEKMLADPKTRELLVSSKQEGLRNKVDATPFLFIDGRPYVYELHVDTIIDLVHEAFEAKPRPIGK